MQAVGTVPVDFAASGVDALTLTGHKLGGPYGVGALVVRRELDVTPLGHGGGQERDIRSGTMDTPGIAAFAAAVEAAVKAQPEHAERMQGLRDDLVRRVVEAVPEAHLHGPQLDRAPTDRLPGNAHLGFPGCEGDSLLMLLDAHGIECSTGLGLLGRGPAALPRAARDGVRRGAVASLAAVLGRPHLHAGRRRRRRDGDRPGRGTGAGSDGDDR